MALTRDLLHEMKDYLPDSPRSKAIAKKEVSKLQKTIEKNNKVLKKKKNTYNDQIKKKQKSLKNNMKIIKQEQKEMNKSMSKVKKKEKRIKELEQAYAANQAKIDDMTMKGNKIMNDIHEYYQDKIDECKKKLLNYIEDKDSGSSIIDSNVSKKTKKFVD